jgi:D-xylose transport system permease protein
VTDLHSDHSDHTAALPIVLEQQPLPAQASISAALTDYWGRIRGGDLGSLPSVLGLVALIVVFTLLKGNTFLSLLNFSNLLNQGAAVIVVAMGLIFVLLLGDIDLSAGYAAGTSGAILAVTLTLHLWPLPLALLASIGTGAVIGLAIGLLVARLGIPSFVVTLAFFLGLQGLQLIIIGEGGTIGINNTQILALMNSQLSVLQSWILFFFIVAGWGGYSLRRITGRRKAGLPAEAMSVFLGKLILMIVLLGGATFLLTQERSVNPAFNSLKGIPMVVPVILVLLVVLTFLTQQTAFGRHIYAVGGNAEAARRAGINVKNVRTICFVICSTMAAFAGLLLVSRDQSVSPSTGGATTLLYAVGAAVIGGTSLFGGRGKIKDAIFGGLVLAVILNGLPLITQSSGIQYIVTGLVLLVAASVDAISRRRASSSGRA